MLNKYPDQKWERRSIAVLGFTFAALGGMLLVLGEWQQGLILLLLGSPILQIVFFASHASFEKVLRVIRWFY